MYWARASSGVGPENKVVFSMKRQRGRGGGNNNNGRRPGHQQNRTFDSNGPDVKVRGPAPHIYEKYLQLARDATSAAHRVMAENCLPQAEHSFPVMRAIHPAAPPPQLADRYGDDVDFDGDGEEAEEAGEGEGQRAEYQQQPRGDYQQREHRHSNNGHQQ